MGRLPRLAESSGSEIISHFHYYYLRAGALTREEGRLVNHVFEVARSRNDYRRRARRHSRGRAGDANLPGLFEKTLKRKENFHLGQVLFRKLLYVSERCERLSAVASQIGNHFRSHFKREWDCLMCVPSLHY